MKRLILGILFVSLFATGVHAEILGREMEYKAGDVTLKGYLVYDDGAAEKRPAILIVHEWWGHNDYVRKRAEMLAQEGYVALAVDMYGDGKQAAHPDDAGKFATEVTSNLPVMQQRFEAALNLLKSQKVVDPERIAAIGYCFGGATVLTMARQGLDLDGVASFHGSLTSTAKAQPGKVKARILVCHGGDDNFITPEQIEAFKKEMDEAKADYQFNVYPGAKHSFTNPDADALGQKFGLPIAYNADADQQSWADLLVFLKQIF